MGFVYSITNVLNGKKYIGSTVEPSKRWDRHKSELIAGKHHCIHLQRSVNKHGIDNFIFEIVIESDNYKEIEERMISESYENNYNTSKSSSGGDLISYHPDRDKIIERMSASMHIRYQNVENRMKHSQPREQNGNWKGGVSDVRCECGSSMAYYATTCADCRSRTGSNNPFFGRTHSETTKEEIRLKKIGVLPTNSQKIIIDGVEYNSQAEAARILGVAGGTITYRLKSSKYPNYIRPSS